MHDIDSGAALRDNGVDIDAAHRCVDVDVVVVVVGAGVEVVEGDAGVAGEEGAEAVEAAAVFTANVDLREPAARARGRDPGRDMPAETRGVWLYYEMEEQ